MRKLFYGLAGASALAMASAANATLLIGSPTTVTTVTAPSTPDGGFHVTFSYNSTNASSPFEELVTFTNSLSGFYGMGVQTTATVTNGVIDPATDVDFSRVFLSLACSAPGPACSAAASIIDFTDTNPGNDRNETRAAPDPNNPFASLFLPAGSYTIHILGTRGSASSFDGNLNFVAGNPLPEPATWALMMLGFGAVGWQLRRRRATVLAQAA